MRLDECQIAAALTDTRLVMTSRHCARIPHVIRCVVPWAVLGTNLTGKPEVVPLRREWAPVHLILRLNILGALGDT